MLAFIILDAASVLEPVRRPNATSDNGLESSLAAVAEFAWLADEIGSKVTFFRLKQFKSRSPLYIFKFFFNFVVDHGSRGNGVNERGDTSHVASVFSAFTTAAFGLLRGVLNSFFQLQNSCIPACFCKHMLEMSYMVGA